MISSKDTFFVPGRVAHWVMLVLIFVWTLAQPLAVVDAVSIEVRYRLFFWKNMLGVLTLAFGAMVLLLARARKSYPKANFRLFILSLPFPIFTLFTMLFRGAGTSLEEQVLFFLWPLSMFVIFPAFFAVAERQRQALFVIWFANLLALAYSTVPYLTHEDLGNWLDYNYRLSFGFLQPNIFSASWTVIFAISFLYFISAIRRIVKVFFVILMIISIIFVFLARSESFLLFCLASLAFYYLFESRLDWRLRGAIITFILALAFIPLMNFALDTARVDDVTSGRLTVWTRAMELNFGDARLVDLVTGRSTLIAGNLRFSGERAGFQAARAQSDSVYLARFLQSGLIGTLLYFLPLLLMMHHLFRVRSLTFGPERKRYSWLIGIWIGTFVSMFGLDVIPSFGNVINILLLVASTVALASNASAKQAISMQGVRPKLQH